MGLNDRIRRLEEQFAREEEHDTGGEHEKRQWLARAHIVRREATPYEVKHARDLIRLFRLQGILSRMSAEELVERIVSWRPEPVGGRSRTVAVMEVSRAIYAREPDTDNMVCAPEWRESFVAGDELRERYEDIPDEVLAEIETVEDLEEFGITEYLLVRAIGPDFEQIPEEERTWRIREHLAPILYGEKGYRVACHVAGKEEEAGE